MADFSAAANIQDAGIQVDTRAVFLRCIGGFLLVSGIVLDLYVALRVGGAVGHIQAAAVDRAVVDDRAVGQCHIAKGIYAAAVRCGVGHILLADGAAVHRQAAVKSDIHRAAVAGGRRILQRRVCIDDQPACVHPNDAAVGRNPGTVALVAVQHDVVQRQAARFHGEHRIAVIVAGTVATASDLSDEVVRVIVFHLRGAQRHSPVLIEGHRVWQGITHVFGQQGLDGHHAVQRVGVVEGALLLQALLGSIAQVFIEGHYVILVHHAGDVVAPVERVGFSAGGAEGMAELIRDVVDKDVQMRHLALGELAKGHALNAVFAAHGFPIARGIGGGEYADLCAFRHAVSNDVDDLVGIQVEHHVLLLGARFGIGIVIDHRAA